MQGPWVPGCSSTVLPSEHLSPAVQDTRVTALEYHAHTNDMFIVSSNMYGKDVTTYFMGGPASSAQEASLPYFLLCWNSF